MKWQEQLNKLAGQDVMLVLAVERDGSTPGASGAKMLVTKTGRAWGTIGGGQLEYSCEARARELLAAGRCAVERFELRPQGAGDLGMVCGGDVTVWFQYLPGAVLEQSPEGPLLWLLLEQDKNGQGQARLCAARELEGGRRICGGGRFTDTPEGGYRYLECLAAQDTVYIFGAGHVAQALAPGLAGVGFSCHVLDDRAEYARPEAFPTAAEVRQADLEHLEEVCARITPDDYVCVMTHGHRHDHEVVRQMLRTPACYIGVIGSARKAAASAQRLREEGFTDQDIARITTPIGLSIGAETPEEIAVSILAQMIQVRAARRAAE